ncbi:hypothetical protein BDR05DRAFT_857663, partial [Suillus weaverae]
LEACIEQQPDILLTEMQDQLQEICGFEVLIATISRTLHRQGFTWKKVTGPSVKCDEDDHAAFKMLIGKHF